MELVRTNNMELEVMITRKDGDCMFSALAHQIFGSHPFTTENKDQGNKLRLEVADLMEKNITEFRDQIFSNLMDMNHIPCTKLNDEAMVRQFCRELRKPGVWGGAETIKAVAQLYQASILIYMEGGSTIIHKPRKSKNRDLAIVYRRDREAFNHYDSLLRVTKQWDEEPEAKKHTQECQLSIQEISEEQEPGYVVRLNESIVQVENSNYHKDIKIATWNVRGCSHPNKREDIDEALDYLNIDIAGIQETHLSSGRGETKQYRWWNAGSTEGGRESRGVAIVIKKTSKLEVNEFIALSDSICSMKLTWEKLPITLITAHISSDTDPRCKIHLSQLHRALSLAQPSTSIIVIGDLNAHFGTSDIERKEAKWIGPKLMHLISNENGKYIKMLMENFKLTLHNSWSQSNTVLTTWSNGTCHSQLDHILSSYIPKAIKYIKAKWIGTVPSDHKMLFGWLMRDELGVINSTPKQNNPPKKRKWLSSALNIPSLKEKYQSEINIGLKLLDLKTDHPKTIEDKWEEIKDLITEAASNSLSVRGSPITPRRRKAIAMQKRMRFLKHRFPLDEEYKIDLKSANSSRKEADRNHFLDKCTKFILDLEAIHPQQRTKELYKLIKCHKLIMKCANRNYIPMAKWEEILLKESGQKMELIIESDDIPLPSAPSITLLTSWIRAGKNGRAPGTDNISLELLANAPHKLIEEIGTILKEAWVSNEIPKEWNTSLQVPLPKTKKPTGVANYRRISLCNILYKLYAKHILHCLDEILPETPSYQAAFLPDRSTDDHTFTAGRVLEERWKGGLRTYVVTLDLEKAFDSVRHEAIISILKYNKVPHKLINRIIRSSLNEDTMIQWCGQRTQKTIKGVGLKQGCPLSPRLFNITINEVLQTAAEVLPFINLHQKNHTTLPIVLVFADDILIISDTELEIQQMIDEMIGSLASIGLKINPEKCQMLIRDPTAIIPPLGKIHIGQQLLATVDRIKYLGVTITNALNRQVYVKERIKKAYATTHAILPFLQKNHLPWKLTRIIYESVIVPTVTYGLKTTVLTKANRNDLRCMERDLVRLLASTCLPIVSNRNANTLLNKKTIVRKISLLRIRYWGHIIRRTEEHMLKSVLSFQTKKRKLGRPCLTWISSLEADKRKYEPLEIDWPQILTDKRETTATSKKIFSIPDISDTEDEDQEWF